MAMDTQAFEDGLTADGFAERGEKTMPPGVTQEHAHPFDVRALVLDGHITLECAGASATYAAGDVFTMAAGVAHAEVVGADGVRYLVGRRHLG